MKVVDCSHEGGGLPQQHISNLLLSNILRTEFIFPCSSSPRSVKSKGGRPLISKLLIRQADPSMIMHAFDS